MFPTNTEFVLRRMEGKRILFADTTLISPTYTGAVEDDVILSVSLAEVVDKDYPTPLDFKLVDERVVFDDLEFIEVYREDIL